MLLTPPLATNSSFLLTAQVIRPWICSEVMSELEVQSIYSNPAPTAALMPGETL